MAIGETYEEFIEKFKPKKTTDDCYTPPKIYEAVASWVEKEYGVDRSRFVRPFFPGGDFENVEYKPGDIVVDNPPFSILKRITEFYTANGVKYFLFAPTLTSFGLLGTKIILDAQVIYENGASVNTSFVTNLDDPDVVARSCPELNSAVVNAIEKKTRSLPKFAYSNNILMASDIRKYSKYGIDFAIKKEDCTDRVRSLDEMKPMAKAPFGGYFILSSKAAAEKAAAEKAAAEKAAAEKAEHIKINLSEREKKIVDYLDGKI